MIVLLHISILISDKLSRKGIENRQSGLILPLATGTSVHETVEKHLTDLAQGSNLLHTGWATKSLVSVTGTRLSE